MSANYPAAGTGGGMNTPNRAADAPWHRWQDWVNLILGIWLFLAPWIWHTTTTTVANTAGIDWNLWVLGVIVVVMALWALAQPETAAPEWINGLAGIWLFFSSFAMGYHRINASAASNQWIVAVIVFILAIWAANSMTRTYSGGRRTA